MTKAKSWYRFNYLAKMPALEKSGKGRSRRSAQTAPVAPPDIAAVHGLVMAGKGTAAYNAHSYPTKVPPEAIEPFLEHFTQPGDVVLDPFCGSGMTGVAALRRGRTAILNDLSPLAVHLAYNHTTPCNPDDLANAWRFLRAQLGAEERRHYRVKCDGCRKNGILRYTIWSDVYRCPECDAEVNLWEGATEHERGRGTKVVRCTECDHVWRKSAETRVRSEPTWVSYSCSCTSRLRERVLTRRERTAAIRFPEPRNLFSPDAMMESTREMYQRSALHLRGIRTVRDFYTPRNLSALAVLWQAIRGIRDQRVRVALAFAFTNTAWHGTKMRRYNARGGQRPLTGTLYIPQLSAEANVLDVFDNKIRQLVRFYRSIKLDERAVRHVRHGSATNLTGIPDRSVDYVFTDPPFGSNIFYADCNVVGEAWLGLLTDEAREAVVNRSRKPAQGGKTLSEYESLIEQAFREMHRVLKPGCWATVVFQSSDGAVWRSIEAAAQRAGFTLHSAQILDKVQQSMKGYKGRSGAEHVASFDVVIHLQKAVRARARRRQLKILRPDEQARLVLSAIQDHFRELAATDRGARTLPFLYSLSVRALLNAGGSVHGLSMTRLREMLLNTGTVEREGRWYESLSSSGSKSTLTGSADSDAPVDRDSDVWRLAIVR